MKTLYEGELRFVPKPNKQVPVGQVFTLEVLAKAKILGWRVYDVIHGSYPYRTPELGIVAQDVGTEAEAQAEADRLNELHMSDAPARKKQKVASMEDGDSLPRKRAAKKAAPAAVVAEPEDEIIEFDTPDYGTVSDEEAAAYTDGIFEKTVY